MGWAKVPAAHRAATIFAPLLTVSYMAPITGGVWLTNFMSFYSQIRNLKKMVLFYSFGANSILYSSFEMFFFFFLVMCPAKNGPKWMRVKRRQNPIKPAQQPTLRFFQTKNTNKWILHTKKKSARLTRSRREFTGGRFRQWDLNASNWCK